MAEMSSRQRIKTALRRGIPDRIPILDTTYWPDAIDRWHREGLPLGMHPGDYLDLDFITLYAFVAIVTIIGIGVALLIGGVVVTETVFAIPGLGRLTVDAILRRDYPIIQGVTLLFSAVYVIVNLLVDLSYSLFDPRIRY